MKYMTIDDLLDSMDETLEDATTLPFMGGKRVVDAEKIREIIDDIRLNMPAEIRQAKNVVKDRNELIAKAKKEADDLIAQAQKRADALLDENLLLKAAQKKAAEILLEAQEESNQLYLHMNHYCESILKETENFMAENLSQVKTIQETLRKKAKKLNIP